LYYLTRIILLDVGVELGMVMLKPKQGYRIERYQGGMPPDYRQKLLSMGMIPGATFFVLRVAPLGDPIMIEVKGFQLSLRKSELIHLVLSDHSKGDA
jgi:ferrous iron transport protein A